jgi:1-acyl-sn-glycerol-3-phosphate acyltransferase
MIFIRSALFNLCFYGTLLVWTLMGCVAAFCSERLMKRVEVSWAEINIAALRLICGIRLEISGREHLPAGAIILASQHQSAFDTFVWMGMLPHGVYVVKQELCRVPLYGWLLQRLGHIPVDRGAGASALRGLLKAGGAALAAGAQVVIFPEGTRVPAGGRGVLQPGVAALASYAGVPVVPVATDSGFCWGRNAFVKRPGTIHVVIRPALPIGLRRPELLAALQRSWDEGQQTIGELVDKSVGVCPRLRGEDE